MVCEIDNIMPNIPNIFPHLVVVHTIVLFLFTIYESNTIECYIALHMPNNLLVGGSVVLIC